MAYYRDQQIKDFAAIRPAGGFRVVSVDFPWRWENYSEKGNAKSATAQSDTMTIEEIKQTPIDLLVAKDAVMFMWVTWPLMPYWNEVITALGFEFAGLAWEWIKYNSATDKYAFGGGYGTRKNLEPCIVCTRGKPKMRPNVGLPLLGIDKHDGVHSVRDFIQAMPLDCIRSPLDGHSRKPDEQYKRMETMFEGPYVELFARQRYPRWTAWGNEVDKFKIRKAS